MPTFSGRHTTSVPVARPPAEAAAAFADLETQIRCHPELAEAQKLDAATLRVRLKEMNHGPVAFSGRYTLHFTREGDTVRWRSTEGNVEVRGEAHFRPAAGGSRMEFLEEVSMQLDLNRILAGVIRPVAESMMARGMQRFVERVVPAIEARGG